MNIYKTGRGIVIHHDEDFFQSKNIDWDNFINRRGLFDHVLAEVNQLQPDKELAQIVKTDLLAPIAGQEVWAAGVTYTRSREARG